MIVIRTETGTCENCGNLNQRIREIAGTWQCEPCADATEVHARHHVPEAFFCADCGAPLPIGCTWKGQTECSPVCPLRGHVDRAAWDNAGLSADVLNLPIDSHCGARCLAVLRAAEALIKAMEPHGEVLYMHAVDEVQQAAITFCHVCLFG